MRKFILLILTMFSIQAFANQSGDITGIVYIATNNAPENSIVGYRQYTDGTLDEIGEFKTGGQGNGPTSGTDPLISAYGLWRSADNKNILVVNPGDGTISSLKVMQDYSLKINNVVKTGSIKPLAIASYKNLVYVASIKSKKKSPKDGKITGYTIDIYGNLSPLKNSTRKLSGHPSSLQFTPDGKFLVAVEISSGIIRVYGINSDGSLSKQSISSIHSPNFKDRMFSQPVGTDIMSTQDGNTYLFVTEARFITSDGKHKAATRANKEKYPFMAQYEGQTSSVSSYKIDNNGKITMIDGDVMAGPDKLSGQQTTCWTVIAQDGSHLWTTNSFTASISSYAINKNGGLKLVEEIAYQAPNLKKYFMDMDLSGDNRFINIICGNTGEIFVFKTNNTNGKLNIVNIYPGSEKNYSFGIVTIPIK